MPPLGPESTRREDMLRLQLRPAEKVLKQFGFIAIIVFGLLGGIVLWKGRLLAFDLGGSTKGIAIALWSLGLLSAAFSLLRPSANWPLFAALTLITFPIGWLVSHLVLMLLFYGIITPLALLFRLTGRDPLQRKLERERETYWQDVPEARSTEDYFSQF